MPLLSFLDNFLSCCPVLIALGICVQRHEDYTSAVNIDSHTSAEVYLCVCWIVFQIKVLAMQTAHFLAFRRNYPICVDYILGR